MNCERVVLTDTASSLSRAEANNFGVELIPFHLIWPDQQFTDFTIGSQEMYQRFETHSIPSTSGPTPNDFLNYYEDLYQRGVKNIVSIHLGVRSMTLNSAFTAGTKIEEMHSDIKIDVINSKSLTIAQQYKVLRAKELINQNKSAEEIKTELDSMSKQIVLFGSTGHDAIPFLRKSGRLSGFQSFAASQLKLIPIVSLCEDGNIKKDSITFGEKKGRKEVVNLFLREIDQRKSLPQEIGIVYTKNKDVGLDLEYRLKDIMVPEIRLTGPKEAGSVLASHVGPGTGVIVGYWK